MKITTNLPQFTDKPTLLVASGAHHASVYFGLNGEIEKLHDLRHDEPTYSDNEGMFKNGPGAGGYGGVLESKKHEATADLSRELSRVIFDEMNARGVGQIYLFVDSRMKGVLSSDMHTYAKRITLMTFDGNFASDGPLALVSQIARRREQWNQTRVRGEAKKLLDRMRGASIPRLT